MRIYLELSLDLCVRENGVKSLTFGNIERFIIQIEYLKLKKELK